MPPAVGSAVSAGLATPARDHGVPDPVPNRGAGGADQDSQRAQTDRDPHRRANGPPRERGIAHGPLGGAR